MEFFKTAIGNPFTWGLLIGLFLLVLSLWADFRTKREFRRYRSLLSDKMELESKVLKDLQAEKEKLAQANERLRIQVAQLNDKPDGKIGRELEILARAEKQLMVSAPGFAGAWETAKAKAADELGAEATGDSMPKRIFRRFLGGSNSGEKEVAPEAIEMKTEEEVKSEDKESTGAEPETSGSSS